MNNHAWFCVKWVPVEDEARIPWDDIINDWASKYHPTEDRDSVRHKFENFAEEWMREWIKDSPPDAWDFEVETWGADYILTPGEFEEIVVPVTRFYDPNQISLF